MRADGTPAEVSRSTAEFKAWRSCTLLFHHGVAETRRKTNERESEKPPNTQLTTVPRTTNDRRPTNFRLRTNDRPHTTPAVSCLSFSA